MGYKTLHKCHICFEGFEDSHLSELHIFLCHSRKTAPKKGRIVEKDRPENSSKKFRHDELAKKDNTESDDDSFDLKPQRRNLENEEASLFRNKRFMLDEMP